MAKGRKDNEAAQKWGTVSEETPGRQTPGAGKEAAGRGDITEGYQILSGTERENWGGCSLSPSGHKLEGNE